jgi:tetratricopeptide (TPR) repeat protein
MTNEEAKQRYLEAVALHDKGRFDEALSLLDEVDAARPNSRQVTYHRALCLTRVARFEEAHACRERLRGRIEPERLEELEAVISAARVASTAGGSPEAPPSEEEAATIAQATVVAHVRPDDRTNIMLIESTFPVSTEEATVTGHVSQGVFRVGDSVTIVSPNGLPLLAPIKRIGTADTPVNLVRGGQRAIMLLEVEPDKVVPGSALTSTSQEEAHARTMVVGGQEAMAPSSTDTTAELHRIERQVHSGAYEDAHAALLVYLEDEPESRPAHRLMAAVHLEEQSPFHDVKKGLNFIRRAYELDGSNDPAVIHTLAHAMAQDGEPDHGLRFLERFGGQLQDIQARLALAERIQTFRDRYGLGNVWEFSDNYGDVILESTNLDEVARALQNGSLPTDAKCRRNRIGEWRPLESALGSEHPGIAAHYAGPADKETSGSLTLLIGVVVVILIAAVVFVALQ